MKYEFDNVAIRMVKEPPLLADEPVNTPARAVDVLYDLLHDFDREMMIVVPIELGRSGLVRQYAGETAIRVRNAFDSAAGCLLFIDEAYSLLEHWKNGFGDEAINTIVQEMENRRDKTIVVFAGYPDKMEEFFARNPGLKSRIPFHISFPDYSPEERDDGNRRAGGPETGLRD